MVRLGGDAHCNRGAYYINNTKESACQKGVNYWMGDTKLNQYDNSCTC